ncbi:hypothetical protein R4P64_30340 [Rhodococcus sp. IEGM 1366]|uniref:hypothetical protein n=1 Tax=Rhodococcus sp. IEGM 1366 TaxID=3082223 RepID=UPI00295422FF|nr:hypothetical protein [Rhodococcus sp. IEGM 1366]MDV8070827.1 hypothetical protein [Rhodococcus sp. IEGM 1366]
MRIELNPLGNSNTPPTYQYFETAAFMPAAATTFENMVKLPAEFFAGDQAHFGDFESYFALRPDGSIAADQSSPDSATDFLIEAAGAGDDLLLLHVGTTYLVADAVTGLVTVSGTRDQATQFVIYATDAEGIVLATSEQTPRYWVINPTGLLTVAARESWSADLEHWMEMEPASSEVELLARMGVTVSDDWPTPCQQSTALFVWQCTGGLFLAAGLGPGIISGQPTPGFTAFVSSLSPRVMAAINAASNALSSTDIRIVAGAGVVCNLFGVLVDEGVWWKLVKMLFSAGVSWWVIPKVMSLAVTYFFAPAVEGILLLTSLLTWFVGVMQGAVSVGQNCGPGPSSNIQPTHQNKAITPVATA